LAAAAAAAAHSSLRLAYFQHQGDSIIFNGWYLDRHLFKNCCHIFFFFIILNKKSLTIKKKKKTRGL
jgi:hypothetical protein